MFMSHESVDMCYGALIRIVHYHTQNSSTGNWAVEID